MNTNYIEGTNFNKHDFSSENIVGAEFENCTFSNCNFTNQDLTNTLFIECEFVQCDFSLVNIKNTAFRDVRFIESKLMGMRFDQSNTFLLSFGFVKCNLNFSSFFGLGLKETQFDHCEMHEVEFVQTNLSKAVFDHCDLKLAAFDNTNLEKADLRTSINYSFDPEANIIHKAKFSASEVIGLLSKYDILIEQ